MSLKHVHTVFILAAAGLASICAVQAFAAFQSSHAPDMAVATAGAAGAVMLLAFYEKRFLDRCRREGIR
jgi:hypothetical protein